MRKESNHQNLRTDTVTGVCVELPTLGRSFTLAAEALDTKRADARIVRTTPVQSEPLEITPSHWGTKLLEFKTENSIYWLMYELPKEISIKK